MEHSLASALGAPKQPRGDKGSSVANSNRALIQTTMAVGVGVCRVTSTVLIIKIAKKFFGDKFFGDFLFLEWGSGVSPVSSVRPSSSVRGPKTRVRAKNQAESRKKMKRPTTAGAAGSAALNGP